MPWKVGDDPHQRLSLEQSRHGKNRSTKEPSSLLWITLTIKDICIRILFRDYSSDFITIIQNKLIPKPQDLFLEHSSATGFWTLSGRAHLVILDNLILNKGCRTLKVACSVPCFLYTIPVCKVQHQSNLWVHRWCRCCQVHRQQRGDRIQERAWGACVMVSKQQLIPYHQQDKESERMKKDCWGPINVTVVEMVNHVKFFIIHIHQQPNQVQPWWCSDQVSTSAYFRLSILRHLSCPLSLVNMVPPPTLLP